MKVCANCGRLANQHKRICDSCGAGRPVTSPFTHQVFKAKAIWRPLTKKERADYDAKTSRCEALLRELVGDAS